MVKCCIFDLDGTILETVSSITHFVNLALQKWDIKPITIEQSKIFVGNGSRKLIERACANGGVTDESTITLVHEYYNQIYDENPLLYTQPFDGILDVLDAMARNGIKLAVLSNKPDSTVKSLVKTFFADRFLYVAGGRDGVPLKPNPSCTGEILSALCVNASEVMFVGDTSVDVETGKNMGAGVTVGVLWGFRDREELASAGADVIVSSPKEILEHL